MAPRKHGGIIPCAYNLWFQFLYCQLRPSSNSFQITIFSFLPLIYIYLRLLFLACLKGKKRVMEIHRIYCTNYFSGSLRPPSRLLTVALYFLFIRFLSALLGSLQAFLNVSAAQVHNSHWKLITGHIWPIFKFKSHIAFFNSVLASKGDCCEPYIKTKETFFKVIFNKYTEHCLS